MIEVLHEMVPKARRIAFVLNDSNLNHAALWSAARNACSALDLDALRSAAGTAAQFGAAVDQIVAARAQAVVVAADPLFRNERVKLQALMQTTRLPVAYSLRQHVLEGGLLSYSSDLAALYRYSAKYAHRILLGAKPADIPVEQPDQVRVGHQPENGQVAGIDGCTVLAAEGGRSRRVIPARMGTPKRPRTGADLRLDGRRALRQAGAHGGCMLKTPRDV